MTQDKAAQDHWSAADYGRNARFVSDLGADVLAWLGPRAGERILDLGCGDGALTERLSAAGASVVGVDASADMVRAALARGVEARVMNGEALAFAREFDAVFSNAALHWMTRPAAVIAGVARALRPGGRFVGEFGGHGNVAAIRTALAAILEQGAQGFRPPTSGVFPPPPPMGPCWRPEDFRSSASPSFRAPRPCPAPWPTG